MKTNKNLKEINTKSNQPFSINKNNTKNNFKHLLFNMFVYLITFVVTVFVIQILAAFAMAFMQESVNSNSEYSLPFMLIISGVFTATITWFLVIVRPSLKIKSFISNITKKRG